ncbi:hypothetical protein [Domibacillus aminovorans]|nr:hypothetical protein [Domibacillus aminovorans]
MKKDEYINMDEYHEDGHFFIGLTWATVLSVPLWISFFGWIKLVGHFL